MIAAMSQADAENSRLSPKRPLGSFHLLRNLRQQRSGFRLRFELAHLLSRTWDAMTNLFLCDIRCSRRMGLGSRRDRSRKLKKSPHPPRVRRGGSPAHLGPTTGRLWHDGSTPIPCQLPRAQSPNQKGRPESRPSRSHGRLLYAAPTTSRRPASSSPAGQVEEGKLE